jgi:hypothetical protein
MTNLIIAGVITTLIIGYRCVKRWVDTKCRENYEQGVNDCKEDLKKEVAASISNSFRAGIEKGKQDYFLECVIESKEELRKYWDFNEISIQNAINRYEEEL